MMDRHIKAPLNDDEVKMLKAGDYVYIRIPFIRPGMQHIRECMKPFRMGRKYRCP